MTGLPNDRLSKEPRQQRSMKLSRVLSDRLDELVALFNRDGNQASAVYRHDLLAVLIAHAPETVKEWNELFDRYGEMKNRDVTIGQGKNSNVIELRPVKPGRRPTA